MAFAERFEDKLRADGTDALLTMLHGGFAFDQVIGGETCAVRRVRDRHITVGNAEREGVSTIPAPGDVATPGDDTVTPRDDTGRAEKGPRSEWLETDFFIFPQNGQKDKLLTGVMLTVTSKVQDFGPKQLRFEEPEVVTIYRPQKPEIYYAQIASRGGRQIGELGHNTYLNHDVLITTPEKEIIPIENFDFEAHKLFMLGFYGGEYKVSVAEKNL